MAWLLFKYKIQKFKKGGVSYMPQKDIIGIKFGVAGGGSISGESGRVIKGQLESIVSQIKLKINIDQEYFRKQVLILKKELDGKLGKLQVGVKAVTNVGAASGIATPSKPSSKTPDTQKQINTQLKAEVKIRKELSKIGEGKREGYRAQLEKELGAQEKELGIRQLTKEQLLEIETITNRAAAKEQDSAEDNAHRLKTKFMGVQAVAASLLNRYKDLIKHNKDATGWAEKLSSAIDQTFDDLPVKEKNDRLREFVQLVREADTNFNQLSVATDTFATKLRRVFERRIFITLSVLLVGLVVRAVRQVYNNVVELDTAMTTLRTTVRASERSMNDFSRSASQAARRLGVSVIEVIEATTAFARLGHNLRDAQILAEQAIIYSRITGKNISDIADTISSAINAFGLGAQDLERVLDQFIHVGNNFSISSEQIARAMRDSAALLAANGNTLQEALGLLGAANAALGNESGASTAMRTIVARLSRDKSELRKLGEDVGGVLTTARLDNRMLDFGVAIKDANGNLRSTFAILNDLSRVWDTLTVSQQEAIVMMIAGERQQAAFFAIMENWSEAEGIVASYRDGIGSLQDAQDEYINSIAGQLERLNATWQEFSETLLNSAVIKIGIQFLSAIAKALNYILSIGDGFLVTIPLITVALLALWAMLKKIKATATFSVFIKGLKGILAVFPAILAKLKAMRLRIRANTAATKMNTKATLLNIKAIKAKAAAQKAAAATNPLGWIMLAVAALFALIRLLRSFITTLGDLRDRAEESREAWQNIKSELSEVNSELEETADRIRELQDLASQRTLSLVEQDELDRLKQTNAQLEYRRKILEAEERIARDIAARDAANYLNANMNASTVPTWVRIVSGIFTGGISEHILRADDSHSNINAAERTLANWDTATEAQRTHVRDLLNEMREYEDQLVYFVNATEQWHHDMNRAYRNFWELEDRFFLATGGNLGGMWESLLSRNRFEGSTSALRDLANAGEVTADSLRDLYDANRDVQSFVRYLQELGVFSWDCADAIAGLVVSINELFESQLFGVSRLDHLDIIDDTTVRFDALVRALEDIERVGVVSATRLRDILETFPELSTYFTATSKGFRLSDDFADMSMLDVLSRHATHSLQEYVDRLELAERQLMSVERAQDGSARQKEELERATQAVANAQKNLNTATEVWAVHLRAQAIRERTDALNEQRDVLRSQLDAYRDLINIRKDLLRTYRREIDYQNELARRQRTVVDLQTQLRLARMDTSAAGRARVRELESQLQTAQDDLDAFTLERAIDVLMAHLDNEFTQYQQLIESQVDRIVEEIANLAKELKINTAELIPNVTENLWKNELRNQLSAAQSQLNAAQSNQQNAATAASEADAWQRQAQGWYDDVSGWDRFWNTRHYRHNRTQLDSANTSRSEADQALANANSELSRAQAEVDRLMAELAAIGVYHQGGMVGGVTKLKSSEEFAKLMKGEFVVTPKQMHQFMGKTLPNITSSTGGANFYAPIVELHCGSVTRDSLPDLKRIVDEASNKAVEKIKSALGSGLDRAGQKSAINKFSRKN